MVQSRAIVSALQFMFILQTTWSYYAGANDACEEFGICEHVDDYPTQLAKDLIKELKSRNTLFNNDEIDMSLENRFDGNKEELCDFTQWHMTPRKAKDAEGKLRIILNDLNDPVQRINIATCNTRKSDCTNLLGYITNYKGVCIQKTVLREMYYVDEKNRSATTHFQVPICCSCKLQHLN